MRPLFLALLFTLSAGPVFAQQSVLDVSRFDDWFSQEPLVEINLSGAMLNLVAEGSRAEDPDFASLAEDLQGVFVRRYTLSSARSGTRGRLLNAANDLKRQGWQTLVRVREDDEDMRVYVRPRGNILAGLVVISIDSNFDEVTIVSISGRIDPSQIGRLSERFGGPDVDVTGYD